MKGIPLEIVEHRIDLLSNTRPLRSQRYRLNPNYAERVKKELDKLLEARFIYPIETPAWLSPIVVVSKKNGKLRICIDYRKLNASTVTDAFPLPYIDLMLESVAGQEMYSFMDGFSGYNQASVAERDREKTAFITEWGAFAYRMMPFGLKNAPSTFQRVVTTAFEEYLNEFMQTYLDDFTVYGSRTDHLGHLRKCLEKCRKFFISQNPDKSVFGVSSGVLLGHIISKDGLLPDPAKIDVILQMEAPVLAQPGKGDRDHPIAYISRKLIPAERNYTTTERETLAIVWAASKFDHHLKANKVKFITNHRAIVDLVRKPNPAGRLARWILALQELDFEVLYNPGKQHVVLDMLSRMSHILDKFTTLPDSWEDKFPDEPPVGQALRVQDRSH
ncbi:hypothetical protein R1flu_002576 [Riccia fluitans]|uniref:Reverse transcriptase domain-containing protein n=1 Tax=Riccia fluitans TaxID=41844 RepID=A0ABD1Y6I5_9MARC